jgi:DNA-binding response OmpR family regulator
MQGPLEIILIVEDDENYQSLFSTILQSAGFKTIVVEDVTSAFEVVSKHEIALVLLDVILGEGGDGRDFLQTVRETHSAVELPVIMTSANGSPDDIVESLRLGANDYFVKPMNLNIILARIEMQLKVRRMERLINSQNLSLLSSAKLVTLGQMASGIVHEIRNPMTIIHGMNEILMLRLNDTVIDRETVRKCVTKIAGSVNRMKRIMKSIQSYSHKSEGHEPFVGVKLADLLDDTLVFCTDRLGMAGIDLKMGSCPADLTVECRSIEISEVLLNLISNAIDAMEDTTQKWLEISIRESGDRVYISVANSGPQIPEDVRAKLFTQTFTSKDRSRGTGIGLGICAGIIKKHAGAIYLDRESSLTTFVIELPKVQPNQLFLGKILIVEDDEATREILKDALEESGYLTVVANDGIEGWRLLNTRTDIALVLTDYKMPNLNGVELGAKIQGMNGEKPGLILMTGFLSEFSNISQTTEWHDIFEKPFAMEELQNSVRRFYPRQEALVN